MKILLLNQAFYPDVVSTAQHAADLSVRLVAAGHNVHVIAGSRAYDEPGRLFPRREVWSGVHIRRIPTLGLGKGSRWRRALDFAFFLCCAALQLIRSPRFDVVIAMTSPPLVAFIASLFVRWKGGRLVYWVMDLNPDEAIAAGWLDEHSAVARLLRRTLLSTLRRASRIVVLDRFMKTRLLKKGIAPETVEIIPPWSHDHLLNYDPAGREAFRREHGLEAKFVVMYSGNHSPCHPLDTLMEAARRMAEHSGIAFCFVGGGSDHARVRAFAATHGLSNIRCLPYQPIDRLSASLSSADLHAVVMGEPFVGIVHPCKIYNVMLLGIPVLYIGPREGHIPDLAPPTAHGAWFYSAAHNEVDTVIDHILSASSRPFGLTCPAEQTEIASDFSADLLVNRLMRVLEPMDTGIPPLPEADGVPFR